MLAIFAAVVSKVKTEGRWRGWSRNPNEDITSRLCESYRSTNFPLTPTPPPLSPHPTRYKSMHANWKAPVGRQRMQRSGWDNHNYRAERAEAERGAENHLFLWCATQQHTCAHTHTYLWLSAIRETWITTSFSMGPCESERRGRWTRGPACGPFLQQKSAQHTLTCSFYIHHYGPKPVQWGQRSCPWLYRVPVLQFLGTDEIGICFIYEVFLSQINPSSHIFLKCGRRNDHLPTKQIVKAKTLCLCKSPTTERAPPWVKVRHYSRNSLVLCPWTSVNFL